MFGSHDARGHPADLDDRLAPAARGRRRASRSTGRRKLGVGVPVAARRGGRVASFGDASANHSTAAGAINAAGYAAYQGLPVPLLFVCEDNGLGISVPHARRAGSRRRFGGPAGPALRRRPTAPTWSRPTTRRAEAADYVRDARAARRSCTCARCGSWATPGSDVEIGLPRARPRSPPTYARDPLLGDRAPARRRRPADARPRSLARYDAIGERVRGAAEQAAGQPAAGQRRRGHGPAGAASPRAGGRRAPPRGPASARRGGRRSERPVTLAQAINRALGELLATLPGHAACSARTSARKGGVYGVTRGLRRRVRRGRVFDTLLDEQSILGLGARRRAVRACCRSRRSSTSPTCTTPRTSCAARPPPCSSSPTASTATRWWCGSPGYAYQKGFGGHFHNDNAVGGAARHPGPRGRVAGPARRRRGDAAHLRRRGARSTARCACSSSRSRSTTRATCTRRRRRLARGLSPRRTRTSRSARRAATATAPT